MTINGTEERPLPSGWRKVKLREIASIQYGKNLPTKNFTETGYPVFGANGVIGTYSNYHYEQEQVLISCRGANSGTINMSPPKCYITNNSLVVELKGNLAEHKRYFFMPYKLLINLKSLLGQLNPKLQLIMP